MQQMASGVLKRLLGGLAAMLLMVSVAHAQAPAASAYGALVKDYADHALFSGVVLVARDGKPVFRQAFGAAEREWEIANTPETRFRIGSITKQFTAAAVLRLVDERKLALDDAIGTYLPDLPAAWRAVTIRQLLQHSSGIPRYTALDDFDDSLIRLPHTPRQIVDLLKDQPSDFAPGAGFKYDNTGYVLLGSVIEAVSGLAYRDYLEQKLLHPLGLTHSGYDDGRTLLPHAAQAYTDHGDAVRKGPPVDMSNAYAAGAMTSTVDDLLAWQGMLFGGAVLSRDGTAVMFADGGHGYGMGWFVSTRFSRRVFEHGGDLMGFSAMLAYYPAERLTVIVLSNYGEEVVGKIASELAGLALGVPPAHRQVKVDRRALAGFAGDYRLAPGSTLTVAARDGRLFARLSGQKELEIYPEGEYAWFYKAVDAQLVFDRIDGGRAGRVTLHQDGNITEALRVE